MLSKVNILHFRDYKSEKISTLFLILFPKLVLCHNVMLTKIISHDFKLTKERNRRYPAKTRNNADDIALLANISAQA